MNYYKVTFTYTVYGEIDVEAESVDDAHELVDDMAVNGEYLNLLDSLDMHDMHYRGVDEIVELESDLDGVDDAHL